MMPTPKNDQFLSLIRLNDDAASAEYDALYDALFEQEAQERDARWS